MEALVPAALGFLFFSIGLMFGVLQFYFRTLGELTEGKVIGIEKYTSKMRSSDRGTSHQTMYRPIVEYFNNGMRVVFSAMVSTNVIRYQVGQRVPIRYLDKGPEYCRIDNNSLAPFSIIFGAIGLIVVGISAYSMRGSVWVKWIWLPLLFDVVVFLFIYYKLADKGLVKPVLTAFLKARIETDESLEGREIMTNQSEVEAERDRYGKVGLIISGIFFFGSVGFCFFLWERLPETIKDHLLDILNSPFTRYEELIQYKNNPILIGIAVLSVFVLMGIHSLIYSLKNLK